MEDLIINYGQPSKGMKWITIIFALFIMGSSIIVAVLETAYTFRFFLYLLYAVCGAIMLIRNTLWLPSPVLTITNNLIETKKMKMDWTSVSRVNIGLGYIVFLLNGEQKQQRLNLSDILYKDVRMVKAKVIELCEQKNIPYHND
jgi:hypothetical protein